MKEAIVRASQGEISSEDWVLATTNTDLGRQQSGDRRQNQEELENLYRADYVKAWMDFLRGLDIPGWRDIRQAETAIARLSNPQDSPLKFVLQRVAWETSWDNPPPMSTAVEGAREGVGNWIGRQTGGRPVTVPTVNLDGYQYGKLGRQFASLARLVGTDKAETGGRPPSEEMKAYMDRLGKLKTRLNKIASGADDSADGDAYDLAENTLDNKDSEISDAMQYVEDAMFASSEAPFRDALSPLMARPMLRSFATLLPHAEEVINVMWEGDVYDAWKELAAKYPFSNARDEADFAEISNFVKTDGVLDKYINEILGDFVVRRGNQLTARQWHGMGVRLNSGFVTNVERLLSLKRISDPARFELQPVPTPGLSEIRVEIDGQTLRYRNGPQPWQAFKWPSDDRGSRIQAVAFDGSSKTVAEYSGRMGLIRMLGQSARTYDPRTTRGQLTWNIEGLGEAKEVKLNFNMISGMNPLQFAALRSLSLPRRITQ